MTYARARLWLGISGVGTLVVLSALALTYQLGWTFFPFDGSLLGDAAALWSMYFAFVLLSFYFDFMGGYWLPCRFGRLCVAFPVFLLKWLRGVAVQGTAMVACALLLLLAGKGGGLWASAAVLVVLQLALVALQPVLARMTGGLAQSPDLPSPLANASPAGPRPTVQFWKALDGGFSGGLAGFPGRERIIVPEHWHRILSEDALRAGLLRRLAPLSTGSRMRGVALAIAWNTLGFIAAASLPGAGVTRVSELVQTILGGVLWNFLGLLVLPTLSRRGVIEADSWAVQHGASRASLSAYIREVDQMQEDEPARHKWVERIFHPVPSVETRLRALESGRTLTGAWHAARLALFLSWASFGLLARAVHCNAGRPELWVLLPSD